MKLTDVQIRAAKASDRVFRLFAGDGLYVVVYPSGKKSFEYRYKTKGTLVALILGKYGTRADELTLKAASDKRTRLAVLRDEGRDPRAEIELEAQRQLRELSEEKARELARRADQAAQRDAKRRQGLTLKLVSEAWIKTNTPHWSDAHAWQVEQQLRDHVYPVLGARPLESIRPADVLELIGGLLAQGKVELARRARQRLDAIFEYAALTYELNVNPVAVSKRELGKRFKTARKAAPAKNFPTIDAKKEAPALLRAMRSYQGTLVTRSLLWLVALTACRTGEARFAVWSEFDLTAGEWRIPAKRMKADREHLVMLSPPAVALLRELHAVTGAGTFVFPHPRRTDKPASENALLYVLSELGYKERMSGHGFRSLFSTLANDSGLWRPDVIEAALAHQESDEVRGAYNRADYLEQRRQLMHWYAKELQRLEAKFDDQARSRRSKAVA